MRHNISHLPRDARLHGPPSGGWCGALQVILVGVSRSGGIFLGLQTIMLIETVLDRTGKKNKTKRKMINEFSQKRRKMLRKDK